LDTLILNSAPIRSPKWLDFLATALISILTIFVVMAIRPAQGLAVLLIAMFGYVVFSFGFFITFGLWLDMTHPMLAIFICYYFFIPYRLIVENRKSWEYYQKHSLLTQVEELKSNFLRMMSHDVKTPVARIQSMAEMARRDTNPLSPTQVDALNTISKSSEELSSFFGSILSLGRIESKEIELHLKSRDVNALLQEVIQKCEYLAKEKNIRVVTEFEPMFSVKIDEDLMRQVFTNLVENAIKYSPENSSILVTTEEVEGLVRVQVADQGIGIPQPELQHLFTKFYRARNARESDTKGSGLGLYLSDYFVRLHKGKINVESETDKGSTFTVELPMNL
jgi:signal transduction histidine kinase